MNVECCLGACLFAGNHGSVAQVHFQMLQPALHALKEQADVPYVRPSTRPASHTHRMKMKTIHPSTRRSRRRRDQANSAC
jgi:hypothetical protein